MEVDKVLKVVINVILTLTILSFIYSVCEGVGEAEDRLLSAEGIIVGIEFYSPGFNNQSLDAGGGEKCVVSVEAETRKLKKVKREYVLEGKYYEDVKNYEGMRYGEFAEEMKGKYGYFNDGGTGKKKFWER